MNLDDIDAALTEAAATAGRPTVVLARTFKGRGVAVAEAIATAARALR